MMRTIQSNGEAVFLEDLVIDANDLMEAGIAETPEQAQELLELVVALVHKNPKNNQRDVLLKMAKKYSKNKLSARMRYIRWIK
jgi:adenine C2-methylase RlmN of 23S rRNA A2503 and tRNA A37